MKPFIHAVSLPRMAVFLLAAVLAGSAGVLPAQAFDQTYETYDKVLKTYVADGRVNYRGLSWTESQRLAFLINLYNAATLKLIVDHYPVKSIKDIGSFFKGPWDQPVVRLFDKTVPGTHRPPNSPDSTKQSVRLHTFAAHTLPPQTVTFSRQEGIRSSTWIMTGH